VSGVRRRAIVRPFSLLLVASQLVVGIPLAASTSTSTVEQDASKAVQTPIVANRHVPVVSPPPTVETLTDTPTDAELSAAHIFAEPLIPMPRGTTPAENRALAQALRLYASGNRPEMVAPVLQFLSRYPQSAWKASLLANLGFVYRRTGYLSRAFNAWDMAWTEAKDETDPRARAVADFAIGEWFELSHKLGRPTAVVDRLKEVDGRHLSGRAGQQMALATEGVWVTRVHRDVLASGAAAIESVLAFRAYEQHVPHVPAPAVQAYHSVPAGMSLAEVKNLAGQAGLNWAMLARPTGTPYSAPAIVHLRADHFVAIVKQEAERYLMIDPGPAASDGSAAKRSRTKGPGISSHQKRGTTTGAWWRQPRRRALSVIARQVRPMISIRAPRPRAGAACRSTSSSTCRQVSASSIPRCPTSHRLGQPCHFAWCTTNERVRSRKRTRPAISVPNGPWICCPGSSTIRRRPMWKRMCI
jgi:hypothetical protein